MTTSPRHGIAPKEARPTAPQIELWDHVRYGQVNVKMLKALLAAAGKKLGRPW